MWLWVRLLWFNEWYSWFSVTRILPREFKDTLRQTHIRVMCKPSLMDDEVDGCCGGGWLLVGGSGSGSSGTSDQHRLIIIVVGVYFWWLNRSRNPQQQIPNTHEIATWRSCWENTNRGTAKGLIVWLHCAPSGLFFVANCYNVIIFRLHVLYIYLSMRLRDDNIMMWIQECVVCFYYYYSSWNCLPRLATYFILSCRCVGWWLIIQLRTLRSMGYDK